MVRAILRWQCSASAVIVQATSGVALGGAEELPIGGRVGGAGVVFRIGETLGQERLVTEDLQPLDWKGPECRTHCLGCQIGGSTFG